MPVDTPQLERVQFDFDRYESCDETWPCSGRPFSRTVALNQAGNGYG